MNWIPGNTPQIPEGSRQLFLVTIQFDNGKRVTESMYYMNKHVMGLADGCCDVPPEAKPHNPDEDGYCEEYEWTGWSGGNCSVCETEWMMDASRIISHAFPPEPDTRNPEPETEAKP
jgi:hypothetical protein